MIFEIQGDIIAAATAFLSGIGTVLTGFLALRYERKRSQEECDRRFQAFKEGTEMGKRLRDADDKGG